MHVYYTRWDKPQQQWQKKWLSAELQARLSPEARRILALDDPLNDELCLDRQRHQRLHEVGATAAASAPRIFARCSPIAFTRSGFCAARLFFSPMSFERS